MMNGPCYKVRYSREIHPAPGAWDGPDWRDVEALEVARFQDRGSGHRPRTLVRLRHHDDHIDLLFRVEDRYVRSVRRNYQDMVYRDSCVEFFAQPKAGGGYFTFEMNAGGCLLLYYIIDPTRVPGGFREFIKIPWEQARHVCIVTSLPAIIDPEIEAPVTWSLECRIPIHLLEHYAGPMRPLAGQSWRANFFKCGDETSHPHWGMWSPIRAGWSFHQPESFGTLFFA